MFRHEASCTVSNIEKGEKILRYRLMLQIHAVQVFRILRRLVIVDHIYKKIFFIEVYSKQEKQVVDIPRLCDEFDVFHKAILISHSFCIMIAQQERKINIFKIYKMKTKENKGE